MSTQTLVEIQKAQETARSDGVIGSFAARASTVPLARNHSLDKWTNTEATPFIGQEFPLSSGASLADIVHSPEADKLIRDLAVLVSQRGVVFFRGQDISIEDQKILGKKLGELSGKPRDSGLHIHPTTEETSPKGDQVSIISSTRRAEYYKGDDSRLASRGWHSDITFEPVPSDYAILKIHTNPPSGGDTLWASAYEAYSRLSPPFAKFLETLEAYHEGTFFREASRVYGIDMRTGERGSPLNKGDSLSAIHPVIRTSWKGLFVNHEFTRRIVGVSRDESDTILDYLHRVVKENHDLQVRFKWTTGNPPGIGDVAIWDNRSTFHTATYDYGASLRTGDRVVSVGERPYFDRESTSRREALGLPAW